MTAYKQALVLREDLEMSRGKMIAQACHASLNAYKSSEPEKRSEWESSGGKKVVLSITGDEIRERLEQAERNDVPAYLVEDAGLTELEPGTVTALGVGPAEEKLVDRITGDLEAMN